MINIVIVNYRGYLDTIECLESVLKFDDIEKYRIFVVDNSENSDSIEAILRWSKGDDIEFDTKFPELVYPKSKLEHDFLLYEQSDFEKINIFNSSFYLIKANQNRGFAAANNLVLKKELYLKDDWFWLLNNDTVVPSTSSSVLLQYLSSVKDDRLGILGGELFHYHNRDKLQALGGSYNKWFATTKHVGEGLTNSSLKQNWESVKSKINYIVGASFLVSSAFVEKVGIMEEDYFLYFEEMDWILRGRENNYTWDIIPNFAVFHKEGASISNGLDTIKMEKSVLADVCSIRNRLLFTWKFFPFYMPTVAIALLGVIFNRLRRKQFSRILTITGCIIFPGRFEDFIYNNNKSKLNNKS
jgi:GT2 family glycosyltransferase